MSRTVRSVAVAVALGISFTLALCAQAPLEVGRTHPIQIDPAGPADLETIRTSRGIAFQLHHEGATYLALHFAEFDLRAGEEVILSDAAGGQTVSMTGRGKQDAGEFWAQHIKGDTVIIEYIHDGTEPRGFRVDRYAAGFVDLGGAEAICGADDKDNAVCYSNSHPTEYDKARAVARLLIQGSSLCTGWLASANNHLVTNEHCITSSSDALNTDYEFMAEAPNCGDGNCQLCWAGTVFSGASFIQDNPNLDYALVQLTSGNPAATYGYLEIDNRAAIVGEEIYIPQHPAGRAKELGIESSDSADSPSGLCHVNTFSPPCSGSGYQDVGYQCDTEGGSSGSPVLARSNHKVIALHHCANCPNRGVPIDLVWAEISDEIGPACVVNADCDDGNSCTSDSCVAGACSNDPLANCCGNGTCEVGEDCNSCGLDCIGDDGSPSCGNGICEAGEDCLTCSTDCNGKQNGNPNRKFCCSGDGLGAGTNPVDCSDARCVSGGFQCGASSGFCCGDGSCDLGEDDQNCAVDCAGACDLFETSCSDGIDNDCDGFLDCSDADCVGNPACSANCEPAGASCTGNSDCCSNKCRGPNGNKTCKA